MFFLKTNWDCNGKSDLHTDCILTRESVIKSTFIYSVLNWHFSFSLELSASFNPEHFHYLALSVVCVMDLVN